MCTAREPRVLSRIGVAVGGTILGAYHAHNAGEKPGRLLLLATPQDFPGDVDVDHFVHDRPSKRLQHDVDFGMGKPPHGSQSPSGMARHYSSRGTQCVDHVRTRSGIDEPIGRAGLVALFVSDRLSESDPYRYQCDSSQFFHDHRIGFDVVVLVAHGPVFDLVSFVHILWSGILFRLD